MKDYKPTLKLVKNKWYVSMTVPFELRDILTKQIRLSTGTSDGVVDSTELSHIASLAGGDTSNITGDEFAFQSISGFSV